MSVDFYRQHRQSIENLQIILKTRNQEGAVQYQMTGTGPWTLKQIREAHDLKQWRMAELLSRFLPEGSEPWSSKTVSAYEREPQKASDDYLQNVAKAFGISTEQIVTSSAHLGEQSVPYRSEPRLDLSLIFKSQSLQDVVKTLSGVVLDLGATAAARLQNAEVLFAEIRKRLRAEASSTGASGAAESLLEQAEMDVDPAQGSPHSPGAAGPSEPASQPQRGVSPESKERPAAQGKALK